MRGNPSTSRCPSSPLSTLSSSAQSNPSAKARFPTEIYAQAVQFSRLPYVLAPSTLPPLSPAARQRIATIQQRCISDRQRNAPEIFLASCRNWRGELPYGWPAEQRYDEDAELMLWKHDVPDTMQQLEEWRAEWRELRKSENRTTLGAPLPGSSKRRKKTIPSNMPASVTKSSKSVPQSTSLTGTELTPKLEGQDDHTVRPATLISPPRVSSSAPPQTNGRTPQTHRSSQSNTKSQSISKTTSSVTSQPSSSTVSIFRVSSQQQLLPFPSALPSSAGRNKIKQSGTLNGMQVEVEVRLSQELPERQKRSWSDLGDLTVFQDYLPPSFPSNLAQSTPPPSNKRRRPSSIKSTTASIHAPSRSSSPLWGAQGTQSALDGVDAATDRVVAMMANEGDEFEKILKGDI